MVLICVPLIISDIGCDVMCLLALCTSSLQMSIKVFCLIFDWIACFFGIEFYELFVYFEYQLVCCIIYKYFLRASPLHTLFQRLFFVCLFVFLMVSWQAPRTIAGIESVLNTFYGMNWERRTITTLITIAFEIKVFLLQKSIEGRDEKSYIQLNNS